MPDGASNRAVTTDRIDPAPRAARTAALSGKTLAGRYEVHRQLGAGGYGEVYLGRQKSMDRPVAIKVIHPHLVSSGTALERFHREARLAARLSDPHIVTYFDFGEADGVLFLVMEYVRGRTLHQILREDGRLEPARALELALQIARGLASAHAQGMVHRDLKPGNVLVTRGLHGAERVKLIDFGLVKLVLGDTITPPGDQLTESGVLVGTPSYMSPEQVRGDGVEARSDVYALGIMLFQALTGRRPFEGGTAVETAALHITRPAPRLAESGVRVSPALDALVARCLAKHPDARPDARGLIEALEALPERVGEPFEPARGELLAARPAMEAAGGGEIGAVGPEEAAPARAVGARGGEAPRPDAEQGEAPEPRVSGVSRPLVLAVVLALTVAVGLGALAARRAQRPSETIPAPTSGQRPPVAAAELPAVDEGAASAGEGDEPASAPFEATARAGAGAGAALTSAREAADSAASARAGADDADPARGEAPELREEAAPAEEEREPRARNEREPRPSGGSDEALGTLLLTVIPWGNVTCSGGIRELESSHVRARVPPGDYSCTIDGPLGRRRTVELTVRPEMVTSRQVSFEEEHE